MVSRFLILFIVVGLFLSLLFSANIYAQETEQNERELNERMQLIHSSQMMAKEEAEAAAARSGVSLYLSNFHTDNTEYKLGAKFEHSLDSDRFPGQFNGLDLAYVIEGIYLEGEVDSLAGFLSLKATLNDRMFAPYFGAGAEFLGVAYYQGFVGLNVNKNFFVETKFINDKGQWDEGDFYSVAGFKINF